VFNARKAAIFHLQLMDPQLYFTFKRGDVLDTSKNILPFLYMEMFSLFKRIKKGVSSCTAPGARLNEREAPGKIVTARPPTCLAQLLCVSHAFVSTLQKHWSKMSELIRFGSLHFRNNWGDRVRPFVCD